MKKTTTRTGLFGAALALAAVMFAASPAKGQYESFFGQESWEYATGFHPIMGTSDYDPELLGCLTETSHFSTSDTVTVDGKLYYNSSEGFWAPPFKLREDTLLGHLYSLIGGREFLICDMSLESGDTFRLPVVNYYDYEPADTMLLIVDSVTFVSSKKVIHLSAISPGFSYWWHFMEYGSYNITLRFMEGVGPMYGLFPPHQLGDVLLCLTKDDSLYYMTHPDIGCWQTVTSIPEYPEQAMTIYPNPANHRISIRFETEEEVQGNIVIRDIVGRVCLQTIVTKPVTSLNIGNLCKGTYLITYKDQNNRKISKKFVKR